MNHIEAYSHKGQGYNPFLISDGWQIAVLNYAPEETAEAIDKLDIHHLTDEAFMLVEGEVVLISASIKDSEIVYDMVRMKPGTVYNVPVNVWHKIAMKPGSSVYIVEKSLTHTGDFEFYPLSAEQRFLLCRQVEETFVEK
ncbi:MAG: hypothetical protein ACI4TU_08395 [Candidatus Cryptobacteroides sp.]